MIERKGDIFTTDAGYIGHGVNVHGVMGAGIAKQFRQVFGEDYYEEYREDCRGVLVPGEYTYWRAELNKQPVIVLNLASQGAPGANAKYPWLFSSLYRAALFSCGPNRMRTYGNTIAIPEIGCGIGGLQWSKVKKVIETVEFIVPEIEFEVWHYGG
jgi:O-acetyl-ADP-ribose deacetylase (regulator of RNase III)